MITVAGQVEKVLNLTIPSVVTMSSSPPGTVTSAQLPYLFVRDAKMETIDRDFVFNRSGLKVITFEICVIIEPSRQNTQPASYTLSRAIMDELSNALETNAADLSLEGYSIEEKFEMSGDTVYFVVVSPVRTSA